MAEGDLYQIFPQYNIDFTISFTDAAKGGGGFSALRDGELYEKKVTFHNLTSKHSMFTEPLQFAIILRKCCNEHMKTGWSVLSRTFIFYFTDNDPFAWALTHQYSSNEQLQKFALEILDKVNNLHSFLCSMWVAGKRLIAQGVDDTSRFRATPDSVPEMWVSALSPIRAPKTLWFVLEILIGDVWNF